MLYTHDVYIGRKAKIDWKQIRDPKHSKRKPAIGLSTRPTTTKAVPYTLREAKGATDECGPQRDSKDKAK